ncbi:TonB-dependent receptor [Hyphomonas pacifica]|uniref:TonB-denpendent receptor n=1 Tax=Hyphomonas pacifica TaxID=1280941 RepID=A0A062TVE0_9PROT|nr:TonB-dependent receptor [Hyphomonas pacifica]KCZ49275.1 TonB-denpendent receptor [Hyphomonas pacifica]RAN31912.1 TonB-denpendent receptor [Hyphomonas pacifica]
MRNLLIGTGAVALLWSSTATAQTEPEAQEDATARLESIVVTAQKRAENVQDVPIAITALSSSTLEKQRVENITSLDNLVPGLRIASADAAANPKIFIRGAGLNDFNPTSSSGVGLYADGVYIGSPLAQYSAFYDLDRVEVLRGPQGTLYGRNTTGGAINVIAKRPTFSPEGYASVEYGSFDALDATFGFGGPIVSDKLAFRVAGQYSEDEGFSTNTVTGNKVNNAERYAMRGTLLYTPDEKTDVLLTLNTFTNLGGAVQPKSRQLFPADPSAAGPDGVCAPAYYRSGLCTDALGYADTNADPYKVTSNVEGKDKISLWSAALTVDREIGDVTLTSITAYQDVERNAHENTDSSPLEMLEAYYINGQKQFSQELRLASQGEKLKWVVGAYYMNDETTSESAYDILRALRPLFASPTNPTGASPENSVIFLSYPYTQETDSYAIFGQADYEIAPRLFLSAGLRWSADEKSMDYSSTAEQAVTLFTYQADKTFSDWSGKLGLKYDLTDTTNVFASYSRGYKSGGFFGGNADSPEQIDPYNNETVDAFEIGSKSDLLDNRLRMNLSGFYYDYQDIQAYSTVERGGLTVQVLDNAASAEMYGAEAEFVARPTANLDLSWGFAWLHAEYGDYKSLGDDYSGNKMPQSPEFSMTGRAAYTVNLDSGVQITPSVDMSYRSKVYFDSTNRERLSDPELWLVGAELAILSPNGHIEGGLWGRNLTDEAYLTSANPVDSLGVDLLTYSRPRSVGVFLRYRY